MRRLNIKNQESKILILLICIFGFLIGCTHIQKPAQAKRRPSKSSPGDLKLKGMDKVEVIQELGKPVAISTSGVSECWYYGGSREVWIWFEDNKVTRWEIK